jgi:acyl dehydratase
MKDFQARFVAPVMPGDTLYTQIWEMKEQDEEGFEDFRFQVMTQIGKIVFGNGRAFIKPVSSREKL